jgi:hypothetical protein
MTEAKVVEWVLVLNMVPLVLFTAVQLIPTLMQPPATPSSNFSRSKTRRSGADPGKPLGMARAWTLHWRSAFESRTIGMQAHSTPC